MSNIAVFERCLEAISIRDAETLAALSTDDCEVRTLRSMVEDTVYRGREGIDRWMRDIEETWAELTIEIEEISEPAPGSVVAFATIHGRGHESSVPVQMAVALTARMRDGLVAEAATHPDREAALRDASERRD